MNMKSSRELKELRAVAVSQYDALRDKAKLNENKLSDEETRQLDSFVTEIEGYDTEIEVAEKREAFEAKRAAERAAVNVSSHKVEDKELTDTKKRFSLVEFVGQVSRKTPMVEGLYEELHKEAVIEAQRSGVQLQGFGIPSFVLRSGEMLAGTTTAGGHAIDVATLGIIDYLENALVLKKMGADFWTGLVGDIKWPREDSSVTASWASEIATAAKSSPTLESITMSPERLTTYMDLSNMLNVQTSPAIEARLRQRLANALARGIEAAAINGSGSSNEPRGILNTSGIGSFALGTNGGAPTWAMINSLIKEVDADNALFGNLGYLGNAKTTYKFKTTPKIGSTYPEYLMSSNDSLNGYKYMATNAVPSDLDKGNTHQNSALIFGNWNDLVIGQWGGLDIQSNPFTKMKEGITELVCCAYIDVEVLRPQSFAACVDITTS